MGRDRARRPSEVVKRNHRTSDRNHSAHAALVVTASGSVVVARLAGLHDPWCRQIAAARNPTGCDPRHVDHDISIVRAQRHRYSNMGRRRLNRQRTQLVIVPKQRFGGRAGTRPVETTRRMKDYRANGRSSVSSSSFSPFATTGATNQRPRRS